MKHGMKKEKKVMGRYSMDMKDEEEFLGCVQDYKRKE
jgi:hypothetical protein